MKAPKAVIYGVGTMGSIISRFALERGVEIVGAIARSPEKVGRDLGEVAWLGFPTGVKVTSDAGRVFSSQRSTSP